DFLDAFEKGISGERVVGEALFAQMRTATSRERVNFANHRTAGNRSASDYFSELVLMPLWKVNADADELFYLKHHQKTLESFRLLRAGKPAMGIEQQINANMGETETILTKPFAQYRYVFSTLSIPNSAKAGAVCIHSETKRRLTITALALER